MIQRYDPVCNYDDHGGPMMFEEDRGEWVKWEDVEHCVSLWNTLTGMVWDCCSCETHSVIRCEIEKYWRKLSKSAEDNS